ncbi:MAG: glycosyltransferase [bacterium]|nr:glycosyltransferase [bacterium]
MQRLTARLEAEGHRWRLLDDGRIPPRRLPLQLAKALLAARLAGFRLVHVHSGNWRVRFLCAVLGRWLGLPVLLTMHSFRDPGSARTRRLARTALKWASGIVAVSEEVRSRCLEHGAPAARLRVQYAYLDPPRAETATLPDGVEDFLRGHGPILAASAFRLRILQGQDLYGLDLLIDLMHQLRTWHTRAGLVFVLPETGLPDYLEQCQAKLADLGLERDLLIVRESIDFTALLRRSDLLVRPTTTDGDSISLREALHVGCRTLASDAVPRPAGVATFRSRDPAHLLQRCREVLADPAPPPRSGQDGWAGLAQAYATVMDG